MEDPGNGESWQTSGRPKEGQEDRKQKPPQNYSVGVYAGGTSSICGKVISFLFGNIIVIKTVVTMILFL